MRVFQQKARTLKTAGWKQVFEEKSSGDRTLLEARCYFERWIDRTPFTIRRVA